VVPPVVSTGAVVPVVSTGVVVSVVDPVPVPVRPVPVPPGVAAQAPGPQMASSAAQVSMMRDSCIVSSRILYVKDGGLLPIKFARSFPALFQQVLFAVTPSEAEGSRRALEGRRNLHGEIPRLAFARSE
jgi:hypothetical protein